MSSEREDLVRATALSYSIPLEVARALVDGAIDDASAMVGDGRVLAPSYAEFLEQTRHITPNANFSYGYVKLLANYADRIRSGELTQLMVSMSPRLGKSESLTVRFPVYWLEHFPTNRIILAAYNRELATSFSARALRLYAERNPRAIRREAVDDWENVYGGGVVAAGVGSGITGRGADCIILDDPVKGMDEAHSPAMRRRLIQWWKTDLRTRRNKLSKTPTIVICTRWHPEDLIGYILSNSDEGEWEIVNIPAIAVDGEPDPLGRQPGESVCEERLPIADLLKMQKEMGPEFEALYQGNPLPPAGGMFKVDKIRIVDVAPVEAIRCRYWDRAATEGKGDWTVGGRMAISPEGKIYIEDIVRGRWEDDEVLRNMRQSAEIDRQHFPDIITYFEREPGASGKSTAQHTVVYMSGYAVEWDEPDGNKVARARPFAAQVNAGNVYLVRAPWNRDYLNELSSFRPNSGSKDDQVDFSSGAYKKLAIDFIRVHVR